MDIIKEKNDTYYQDEKKMNLNILASKTNSNHGFSYKGYEKILRAKKEYLPKKCISFWEKHQYAKRPDLCKELFHNCPDNIQRIHYSKLSVEEFREKFEKPGIPVIITGLAESMNPEKYWTFDYIFNRFREVRFRIAENDLNERIEVKMKYFREYILNQQDDSPLYVFEGSLEQSDMRELLNNYHVPEYFTEDLFGMLGEKNRPPYRYLLMGPQRSGTPAHIDPLFTSAWNLLLQGHKRWVFFPNDIPRSIVKGLEFNKDEYDEAIYYFTEILPKIKQKEGEHLRAIEFIQYPGDLVFVPSKWWHAVLNLDDTIAINHDFCSSANFEEVWRAFRSERKKLACLFLKKLQKHRPDLYEKALKLNIQDGFIMHDQRSSHSNTDNKQGVTINEDECQICDSDSDTTKSPETSDTSYSDSETEEQDDNI